MYFGYYSIFKPLQMIWLWYFSYLWMNYHVSDTFNLPCFFRSWGPVHSVHVSKSLHFTINFSHLLPYHFSHLLHSCWTEGNVCICVCGVEEQLHNPRVNTECYKWDCLSALSALILKDQIVICDKHFSKSYHWIPACFDNISLTMFQWIVLYLNGA